MFGSVTIDKTVGVVWTASAFFVIFDLDIQGENECVGLYKMSSMLNYIGGNDNLYVLIELKCYLSVKIKRVYMKLMFICCNCAHIFTIYGRKYIYVTCIISVFTN